MERPKSLIFALLTIILILLDGLGWSHGCVDQEREALLLLKPLFRYLDWPVKAKEASSNCCEWKMVKCNVSTGRITELSLSGGAGGHLSWGAGGQLWYLNASYFLPFEQLTSLDFSNNRLAGFVENQGFETLSLTLTKLEELNLGYNHFNDNIISSLSGFSSLRSLYLYDNEMGTTLDTTGFENLWRLSNLELLDLGWNNFNSSIMSSLRGLSSLKDLNLAGNKLSGTIDMEGFRSLKRLHMSINNNVTGFRSFKDSFNLSTLEELFLDGSILHKDFLQNHVESLTSLKVLHLSNCSLKGALPDQGWCDLKNLEDLDLGYNELGGTLPPCLANLSSIRFLDLSHNKFIGNIASTPIPNLKSVELLSLDNNHFELSLKAFANHSSLKVFFANDGNQLIDEASTQPWPPKFQLEVLSLSDASSLHFLYHQFNLRYLSLSNSKFGGAFPIWLFENNTRLQEIHLRDNSLMGPFQLPAHPNRNLSTIDISHNKLEGYFPLNISSIFPNVEDLNISKNSFVGTIPPSLGDMKSLRVLDFSDNQFSGEIKEQFANTPLTLIKLSNNNLSGCIPHLFDPVSLAFLLLDGNKFVGEIPDLSSLEKLRTLDISRNSLSGRLPSWMANMSRLREIAMSDNQFEGSIPLEFCKLYYLRFLDLSRNDLSGFIPPCFSELTNLKHVLLSRNQLRGPIPYAFRNCTDLRILDLGGNNFSGTIPNWIGNFSRLVVLRLQANNFHGNIPIGLCHLQQLNILTISSNNLSGSLHACLSNLSSIAPESVSYPRSVGMFHTISIQDVKDFFSPYDSSYFSIQEVVELTTKSNSLPYVGHILDHMYEIDLSSNRFSGKIPIEFGNISNVRSLNLSHNNLIGFIPTTFSNLKQLESLDLSYNNLHGRIPLQLIEVTSLAVFIVAHNNLSGPVPTKNQFGTFNESSYEGNPLLCGPSLKKSCDETNVAPPTTYPLIEQSEDDSFMETIDFWVSFVVAYTVILLGMATVLCINPYWRQVWFYHIGVCINVCYYFVVDKF